MEGLRVVGAALPWVGPETEILRPIDSTGTWKKPVKVIHLYRLHKPSFHARTLVSSPGARFQMFPGQSRCRWFFTGF